MKNTGALDWNDLKYFLAVARAQGLTPAAGMLHTSASTVSRHIDAMEAQLGVRLFLRQQSGYQLTDQGGTLFEHVAEVERAMLAVERQGGLLGKADDVIGPIRLATSEMLSNSLVAPHLHEFTRRHPQATIELIASRDLADLSRRDADLALRVIYPHGAPHHPDYIAHELGVMPFALYCTRALLDGAGGDWRALPFLSWGEPAQHVPHHNWFIAQFPGREPLLRSNSMQALVAAASTGLGLVLLPHYVGFAAPALLRIDEAGLALDCQLWLLYHRDLKSSRRVLAMRDFVQDLARRYVFAPA